MSLIDDKTDQTLWKTPGKWRNNASICAESRCPNWRFARGLLLGTTSFVAVTPERAGLMLALPGDGGGAGAVVVVADGGGAGDLAVVDITGLGGGVMVTGREMARARRRSWDSDSLFFSHRVYILLWCAESQG